MSNKKTFRPYTFDQMFAGFGDKLLFKIGNREHSPNPNILSDMEAAFNKQVEIRERQRINAEQRKESEQAEYDQWLRNSG